MMKTPKLSSLLFLLLLNLTLSAQSVLYFKDSYIMPNVINSYRFKEKAPYLSFTTNKNGIFTISTTGAVIEASVEGYGTQTGGILNFDMSGNTQDRLVTVELISGAISQFNIANQNVKGDLNMSNLVMCSAFDINDNLELTSIINPISSVNITRYYAYTCGYSSLDLSTFSNLGGSLRMQNNPNLVSLSLPSSSSISVTEIFANSCNISSMDFGNLSKTTTAWAFLMDNPNMSNLVLPVVTAAQYLRWYNTNVGYVDVSKITGSVQFLEFQSSGLTSAHADQMIVEIDSLDVVTGTLNMGGTNGALTDGSISGYDGLAAKASLQGKGVTVISN